MGSPKHLRKLYEKPKKLWDTARIAEERGLATEYGLRSMHELWRMKTLLRKTRRNARQLLSHTGTAANESEKQLLARAKEFLIRGETATLDSILALTTKDILERRLQTQVVRRGFAKTMRQARQLITFGSNPVVCTVLPGLWFHTRACAPSFQRVCQRVPQARLGTL